METSSELAPWVTETIRTFCNNSPDNRLEPHSSEPAWEAPLVAFARGDDPLFTQFKRDIGEFYWTPEEAFRIAHPDTPIEAEALSVISWILPQTEATRVDQRQEVTYPSRRWSLVRFHGEAFNCSLRLYLVEQLLKREIQAVAPERLAAFDYCQSPNFGIASNWSERHTAYAAGLGTFGLSDGLITPAGKAMRCGSVVVKAQLPATERPYTGLNDYCLWYANGSCGACMLRCPVQAISVEGHDKQACFDYIRQTTAPYAREKVGVDATPCGLCQVRIPCEAAIPAAIRKTLEGIEA